MCFPLEVAILSFHTNEFVPLTTFHLALYTKVFYFITIIFEFYNFIGLLLYSKNNLLFKQFDYSENRYCK